MITAFRTTICGIEELPGHREAGVSHVLSILDPGWPVPEAFGVFGAHRKLELRFHDVIEQDVHGMLPPREAHVAEFLAFGRGLMTGSTAGTHLLVHCHAGVSRSTAALALMLAQARPQVPAIDIFREVLQIRPQAWPNLRIIEMGDRLLQRNGDLVAAVHELYRAKLVARPELAREMRDGGRGREVAGAPAHRSQDVLSDAGTPLKNAPK